MRLAYKAFEKGLVCRGVQFAPPGVKNVTPSANCARDGWHCAEDPADCLSYYPNIHSSVYAIVQVDGDTDEDGHDSKIACTELTICRVLELKDYFLHILLYMARNPGKGNSHVQMGYGDARGGYTIVRGQYPRAKGRKGAFCAGAEGADQGGSGGKRGGEPPRQ